MLNRTNLHNPMPETPTTRHDDPLAQRIAEITAENAELQRLLLDSADACEESCLDRCRKPTARRKTYPCRPAAMPGRRRPRSAATVRSVQTQAPGHQYALIPCRFKLPGTRKFGRQWRILESRLMPCASDFDTKLQGREVRRPPASAQMDR